MPHLPPPSCSAVSVITIPKVGSSICLLTMATFFEIAIYKLGDVGISSNPIGSLSPTNGQ